MTTQAHKDQVARLVEEEGAQTHRFWKNMLEALRVEQDEEDVEYIGMRCDKIVPDAYKIHPDLDTIEVWEVESSYKISPRKLAKLRRLWFSLDCLGWDLLCHNIDAQSGASWDVDPCTLYLGSLTEEFAA